MLTDPPTVTGHPSFQVTVTDVAVTTENWTLDMHARAGPTQRRFSVKINVFLLIVLVYRAYGNKSTRTKPFFITKKSYALPGDLTRLRYSKDIGRKREDVMESKTNEGKLSQKNVEKIIESGDLQRQVVLLLEKVLNLGGRTGSFTAETPLLGHLPEMDSLGAVGVIAGLEERFRITIDDDEIDGSVFQTLGSLVKFVESNVTAKPGIPATPGFPRGAGGLKIVGGWR